MVSASKEAAETIKCDYSETIRGVAPAGGSGSRWWLWFQGYWGREL